jgi:imidazole glycerol-phosphate synthase subunit HisF
LLKTRLIPVLLLQNGLLVRSEQFRTHQIIGNPLQEVMRFNEWYVDELIYLDISRDANYDLRRDDHKVKNLLSVSEIQEAVSRSCFMPLTWGGRLRTLGDMASAFANGADKIAINSQAIQTPEIITQGARQFGSQAIVVSVDVLRHPEGCLEVFTEGGRTPTGRDPQVWAREAEDRGAGELLIQSIDRDGTGEGYDLDLIERVAKAVRIPVIACGGVGQYEHYAAGIRAGASAVAAANIWHFKEMADRGAKRAMSKAGIAVRQ